MINLKLTTTDSEIKAWILSEFSNYINKNLSQIVSDLNIVIKKIIYEAITQSSAWKSLESGKLKTDFGLNDAKSRLGDIIKIWIDNVKIISSPVKVTNGQLYGKITVQAVNGNYSDVLGSNAATLISKGGPVDWLRWLLLEGDKIILRSYEISYNLNSLEKKYSRTKQALMFKLERNHSGGQGPYKVPSEFSGTATDNFITEAFDNLDVIIEAAFNKILKNTL